jgi:NAD(P)-dependent dehydrogenase (short-subunit alcohol dehydrogenase family)
MEQLVGKVAVVTGAASGIGLAMCEAFSGQGMRVVMADVEAPALKVAATALEAAGADVLAVVTDVSSEESVDALAQATVERFGAAHLLCNNAGVGGVGDPWEGPLSGWEWTIGVDLMGVVHGVRAFLPILRAQDESHIVNSASIAGLLPTLGPPYAAAKYAVVGLSQALFLGEQVMATGVGVSVLCPGYVRTRVGSCERNWPPRLGPLPETPAGFEFVRQAVLQAIDSGVEPSVVAKKVIDAVMQRRFWVLTHDEWMPAVAEHCRALVEQRDPTLPPLTPSS